MSPIDDPPMFGGYAPYDPGMTTPLRARSLTSREIEQLAETREAAEAGPVTDPVAVAALEAIKAVMEPEARAKADAQRWAKATILAAVGLLWWQAGTVDTLRAACAASLIMTVWYVAKYLKHRVVALWHEP
jgi:hypothetical protein